MLVDQDNLNSVVDSLNGFSSLTACKKSSMNRPLEIELDLCPMVIADFDLLRARRSFATSSLPTEVSYAPRMFGHAELPFGQAVRYLWALTISQ